MICSALTDGIFVEGSKFKANEAAMTGEPLDIQKDHVKDPFLLSGTSISEGSGRMIVVAVGGNSQWGVILKTLIVEPQSTPLQAGAYTRPLVSST